MVQFVIYLILVAFYIISYHLLRKYDNSERRLVFVGIWAVCLLTMIIYPFFLPKWWKLLFFFSGFVFYASLFMGAEKEKSWTASGSNWSHFFIMRKIPLGYAVSPFERGNRKCREKEIPMDSSSQAPQNDELCSHCHPEANLLAEESI